MNTLQVTKQWSCVCGFYDAKLHKEPSDLDYSFFLKRVDQFIRYAINQGHNVDNCDKAGI